MHNSKNIGMKRDDSIQSLMLHRSHDSRKDIFSTPFDVTLESMDRRISEGTKRKA